MHTLIGGPHTCSFSVPYRGYLMCSNEYCGELRTTKGRRLTNAQHDALNDLLRKEYR